MSKTYEAWETLFKVILEENDYYDNIRKWLKLHDATPADEASNFYDYYENAEYCTVYEWLDSIENYLADISLKKRKSLDSVQDLVYAAFLD